MKIKKILIILLLLAINFGCQNQSSSNFKNTKNPIIQFGSETINCRSPKDNLQREICGEIEQQEAGQAAWDAVMDSRPPLY
ncbi:hypothetical protein KKF38_03640 [Patescibacteria group bacterium]|nr:hypothetical protein [Patescibacteria group bacterium]